jgi:hypothetical protein
MGIYIKERQLKYLNIMIKYATIDCEEVIRSKIMSAHLNKYRHNLTRRIRSQHSRDASRSAGYAT